MCGIWASLGLKAPCAVIDAVAHRGPDGKGWRDFQTSAGPLILAHHRLAIVDTTDAGLQPMSFGDGRYWLVFNGMIYNYRELRKELQDRGYDFKSHTDSEILLAAYVEWGNACLDRFNGMFAFVIWDGQEEKLFAARDRFGIKPLYWRAGTQGISFASEIKQFTKLGDFEARLNPARAYDFLTFGLFDHGPETLFQDVKQLRPGDCLSLDLKKWRPGNPVRVQSWYRRPVAGSLELTAEDAQNRFRTLLEDSIRLRLRADVPVGACFSGGLDSSTIVCLAKNLAPHPLITVSACYENPAIDESRFIKIINALCGSEPVSVYPDGAGLAERLETLIAHQDGPFASTSVFAQWCVFEAAREAGLTVMLDGQGADEQLCGYHPAFTGFLTGLMRSGQFGALTREASAQRRRHGVSFLSQVAVLGAALLPSPVRQLVCHFRSSLRPEWLNREFASSFPSPLLKNEHLDELIVSHMFETSLPMLLHYEDRSSMAFGIESRLPFLDFRIVELLVGLGGEYKIVDGETKWLLRRAMEDVLPPQIRDRQDKIGFATPELDWIKGPARSVIDAGLEDAVQGFPGLFAPKSLHRLKEDVFSGRRTFDFTLWRVACFGTWARVFGVSP